MATAAEARVTLHARGITAGYGDGPDVVRDITVAVRSGQILCLVGPNGAGKSTVLSVMAGGLAPRAGQILLGDDPLSRLGRRERARRIGYLPQDVQPSLPYTTDELVALGRFPHRTGLGFETEEDQAAVERAMSLTRVEHLMGRQFREISGGERKRVLIASVLTGDPEVILLDEPTASLDMDKSCAVFSTLVGLASRGAAVVVVTHNLNLAGLFADELVLLADRRIAAQGHPSDVMTEQKLRAAYGRGFILVPRPDTNVPAVLPAKAGDAP